MVKNDVNCRWYRYWYNIWYLRYCIWYNVSNMYCMDITLWKIRVKLSGIYSTSSVDVSCKNMLWILGGLIHYPKRFLFIKQYIYTILHYFGTVFSIIPLSETCEVWSLFHTLPSNRRSASGVAPRTLRRGWKTMGKTWILRQAVFPTGAGGQCRPPRSQWEDEMGVAL